MMYVLSLVMKVILCVAAILSVAIVVSATPARVESVYGDQYFSAEYLLYYPVRSAFNCTFAPVDCSNHGSCNLAGTACICNKGYTTYDSVVQCNYEQKNQLVAFLLSFFLGEFGAGRWYVTQTLEPALKLCVPLVLSIIGCIVAGITRNRGAAGLAAIGGLAVFCWWLADVIMFGMNTIPDGNGIPLNSW